MVKIEINKKEYWDSKEMKKRLTHTVNDYIPECNCNVSVHRVYWRDIKNIPGRSNKGDDAQEWAEDHEEMHQLSYDILDYINRTGNMDRDSIYEEFGEEYNIPQISIAASVIISPLKFPRRRHAPPKAYVDMRDYAYELTEEYRYMKYFDLESDECDTTDDIRCRFHEYFV